MKNHRYQTLVAVEWDDGHEDVEVLLDELRQHAGADPVVGLRSVWIETALEPRLARRVIFRADRIRNTNAHGIGCQLDFVCHIEAPSVDDWALINEIEKS